MQRIKSLRQEPLSSRFTYNEFYCHFFRSYFALEGMPEYERYAESAYAAFSSVTPVVSPGELILGKRITGDAMSPALCAEWEKLRPQAEARMRRCGGGQDSHMAIDYEKLLSVGIDGIISEIDGYMTDCPKEKQSFYCAARRCLEGVLVHAEAYADACAKLSEDETDPMRREELSELAHICRRVPRFPAATFHEAVQSVHFISHCLTWDPFRLCPQQFQLGHPDRYLAAYYEADLAAGRITPDRAQLLLCCLGIQINNRVPSGLSSGYMVGGRDKEGNTVANALTEMCLQVIPDIHLVYPSVGLCYTQDMPPHILDKAVSILLSGHSHPAIFNDEVITRGLLSYGVTPEEASDYIHSTCVEITPTGASNVWVASPYTNLPALLLEEFSGDHPDFESLFSSVIARLDGHIRTNWESESQKRLSRAEHSMNPLLSCFVRDCLADGVDIEAGGARYNWIMPSFVGMANLVDSLYAVKTLVYDTGEFTLASLSDVLSADFEGKEALRQRILTDIPKYGNNCPEIDDLFRQISEHITAECAKYNCPHQNGQLIPSVFCWVMHELFGRKTGATPDGRRAGFPLGDGSGPCQGREMKGPTASILSSTSWDHTPFIGGVAVNLKFSRSALGPRAADTLQGLILAYLSRGGFETQINVIDNETLRKAQKDPESYRDLVVRIGGYSDYFVRLSREMQEELILRTSHTI